MNREELENIYGAENMARVDKVMGIVGIGEIYDEGCSAFKEVVYYADGKCDTGYDIFDWTYRGEGSYGVDHFDGKEKMDWEYSGKYKN